MTIQDLLDEHIAPLYRTQLVRQAPGLVVRMIGDPDAPPRGNLDPEILIWCETLNEVRSQKSEVRSYFCNGDLSFAPKILRLKRRGFRPTLF
ncbi:MAG: DUF72 domain-containing protein [Okeania sp. SIO2D1]|nr:DUF72 domain-containing protein [Okeania sp. SIO2D1]